MPNSIQVIGSVNVSGTVHPVDKVFTLLSGISTVAGNGNSGSYKSVRWYASGVEGVTAPYNGMKIAIKVPLAGVGTAGAVLSINGNTDAEYHPLAYNVNTVLTTHFPVNSIKVFIYDANQTMDAYLTSNTKVTITGVWKADSNYDSNTTLTYGTLAYYFRPYAAQTIYRYKFVMLDKDNRLVPLTTTNVANGTAVTNQTPTDKAFRPEKIYWYNATGTINAGAAVGGNTLVSIGYNANNSTNGGMAVCNFNSTISAYRMIYLCGNYNKSTGLFTLRDGGTASSTNYYVQVPTNTANLNLSNYFNSSYDYILLGGTYSSDTYIHLMDNNPMYYFDGTNLIPYNATDTWRNIKVNDNELLGTGISTGAVNFKNGGNITVTGSGNNITLGVTSGYSIPSTTNQTAWSAKYDKPSGGIPDSDLASTFIKKVNNSTPDSNGNVSVTNLVPTCVVGSDSANTAGWYKIATSTLSGFGNQNILYFIKGGFSNGYSGILNLEMRSDHTCIRCWKCCWVARHPNLTEDRVIIVINGMTWTMYAYNDSNQYGRLYFTEMSNRSIDGGNPTWSIAYFNSNTPETTEPTATVTSSDGFIVERAKKDKDGNAIDTTYLKTSGTAANSSKLNNQEASYYLNYNNLTGTPIPGDSGEIKTKYRCALKGSTGSGNPVWYYKLVKLPADNSGNYASAIINGRIGGWVSGNMSSIYCLIWNRDGIGFALLDLGGTGTMSSIFDTADLVAYKNSDNTADIYVKCKGYFTFDLDVEVYQSSASITYDGTHITTTPSGTESGKASTSTSRLELEKGVLKVNGTDIGYKILESLRKGSEADTAVGYYKIATINHYSWNFCDFCMLLKNSYAGTTYSTVLNCSCSDSNTELKSFTLNIIAGTNISNKLAYLYTYDSSNNLIKIEVFIHATRFEHPTCYILNARPGQQLVIPTEDEFNKAVPDKPTDTKMTGYATTDNRSLLNYDLGVTIKNTTTDEGWGMFNSTYDGFLLKSVRFNDNSPAWGVGDYGAGIIFGGGDTKGVISTSYRFPIIKFASGNGDKPVWWIGLTGTSAKSYDLDELKAKPTRVTGSWTVSTTNPGPMVDIILDHPDIKIYYKTYISGARTTDIASVLFNAHHNAKQHIYMLSLKYLNAGGNLTTIDSGTIYYEYFE